MMVVPGTNVETGVTGMVVLLRVMLSGWTVPAPVGVEAVEVLTICPTVVSAAVVV
jgi:hypothetical protein